ncbi:MAG: transposase, partial [Gammaproteobacteria bacterium]
MAYHPDIHHRRSIRLKDYDYSKEGAYFVTICTHEREYLFGEIVDGVMGLNDAGKVARQCWEDIPNHFPHVVLDVFVIMPNHIHGVVVIKNPVGGDALFVETDKLLGGIVGAKNFSPLHPYRTSIQAKQPRGTSKTIGSIVRGFKIGVTKWMRQNTPGVPVWQRNYYERLIRNDREMAATREYIVNNPAQ